MSREHHEGCVERGYYHKYDVQRVDRSPRHEGCEYFVLDLTHDPEAREAVLFYVSLIEDQRQPLAADLRTLIASSVGGTDPTGDKP